MKKQIYLLDVECSYRNINRNKIGKMVASKNVNKIIIHNVFTENTVEGLQNCERSIRKIEFEIKMSNICVIKSFTCLLSFRDLPTKIHLEVK